ncbi:MAG: pyridoxamine 5'-phosphate oxidase family protein [Nitrososphaerales archaeon]
MGKVVGEVLPKDLQDFLGDHKLGNKAKKVVIFTTVDENGFPRHGMLSMYEILAKDSKNMLMVLYPNSRSTQNILRTGKVSLMVVDGKMSYYIRGDARRGVPLESSPTEILFEITIREVIDDREPMVKIISGITFEGYPVKVEENRLKMFSELLTR